MYPEDVRALILQAFPEASVEVQDFTGTGDHFQAMVVSERFAGLTMIKQHKLVYQSVQNYIDDGRIHALALRTYTPEQWRRTSVQVEL
ncbi:MAG: BolA/IbaG family iron-sulfur metabolism protein [Aphanocapsa lilacina HA4352-LM1]|jgi:acid stress-induced BolA-like protein IbaG/YrbA|nr:BolA/IbaG family iron-sulfur metabolism protein [Aphanocapsa lilacina HA4352-LM1]